MKSFLLFSLLFLLLLSCKKESTLFTALTSNETNIDFRNNIENSKNLNILNYLYFYNGAGVASGDFNNDGLADLYFVSNQFSDKFYLNLGDFRFKDITERSGINNDAPWTTGVTTVDINSDGLLDIYVCKLGKHLSIKGRNLLFVNQGIDENGIPFFKEEASLYNLDIESLATQSAFFDYDGDGDLDMFLLNHSLYPNSNYNRGSSRKSVDKISGDKLFENIDGKYVDVSSNAGIFQGKIGYGLGVSIGDINNDGYPDIYVGNDFFENDYLYLNNRDKTFKEVISENKNKLGHTSHYSMGNALADLDNNEALDIISLDMLPEDLKTYKTSGLEYPYQTYEYYLKNGYTPQFMQNTLHYNNGNATFSETAYLSGIAATEWSWCPIVSDFDNDGFKDLYITNGILGATNDMDFINFISDNEIQKQLATENSQRNVELSKKIPEKKVKNYFYQNKGDRRFENVTDNWVNHKSSFSNGGVAVDLDNDGHLDLVINNVNEEAYLFKNTSKSISGNNYLRVECKGSSKNTYGIGVKVKAYLGDKVITEENYTTKGYLSASEPKIHLGLGENKIIDSLKVIWVNGFSQTIKNIKTNQTIKFFEKDAVQSDSIESLKLEKPFLVSCDSVLEFKHNDSQSIEFNRDPLIPFANTNLGPDAAIADVNKDGMDDIFICGGKLQSSKMFLQNLDGNFTSSQDSIFEKNAKSEDVKAIFFNANNDGYKDLLVVSGGNEFRKGKPLQPRLYINNQGVFKEDTNQFKELELNASSVQAIDIDNDGDQDVCFTSNLIPWEFGKTPRQFIYKNDGSGNFQDVTSEMSTQFQNIGNVQEVQWVDINQDSFLDAVVVGKWMPVSIFLNDGKKLTLQNQNGLDKSHGWWNTVKVADFDNDGDIDIIAGNWGLNTRLKPSINEPITLYRNDFDDNKKVDPVITHYHDGKETVLVSKDILASQLPFLNKKYLYYKDFAEANFDDLFSKIKIKEAEKKQVFELASCYFENKGDSFKAHKLPFFAQISSVNAIEVQDFNKDGFLDVFLVGNNYHVNTQLGKLDALHGVILMNDKNGFFKEELNHKFNVEGDARNIDKIKIKDDHYFLISRNNDSPVFLKIND
ncbi:VCBS repeat-containing protein [Tenacibaculum xiamenense]|uniref:VCBS repeat-containing protein n=1 Tax=Tenacibaculum xiamenense TaxID=1261553 RepID=UPI003894D553